VTASINWMIASTIREQGNDLTRAIEKERQSRMQEFLKNGCGYVVLLD
jgi:hypothetical protein